MVAARLVCAPPMGTGRRFSYALDRLYEDQDPHIAAEAIAPLLCMRAQRLRAVGDADDRWEAVALLRDAELWWALSRCAASPGEAELGRCRALRREAPSIEVTDRILSAFGELLSGFAETTCGAPLSLVPAGAPLAVDAEAGAVTLQLTAGGLHPFALEDLDHDLGASLGRQDVRVRCSTSTRRPLSISCGRASRGSARIRPSAGPRPCRPGTKRSRLTITCRIDSERIRPMAPLA